MMEPPTPELAFPGWQQHYAEVNGLRLSFLEWGAPSLPAVLLLHGLTVEAHSWDPVASLLQERFRLIVPDLRGHGDSAWPQPPSYTTQNFVDDLVALLRAIKVEHCAVIGHSLGAAIGIALAQEASPRIERLAVVESAPLAGSEGAPPWAALTPFASFADLVAATAKAFPRSPVDLIGYMAFHNARRTPDGAWTRKHSPHLQTLTLAPLWDKLDRLACPMLVVNGSLSTVFPLEQAQRLVALAPDARMTTIADAGHPIAQEQPDALAELLLTFLSP